ncbi:MAG: hypothetical protein WCF61_13520 [Terriglobales bacterium]
MAAPSIAPQVEPPVVEKTTQVSQPKAANPNEPVRDLLAEIFKGHEEFLGWTPD